MKALPMNSRAFFLSLRPFFGLGLACILLALLAGCGGSARDVAGDSDANGYVCRKCKLKFYLATPTQSDAAIYVSWVLHMNFALRPICESRVGNLYEANYSTGGHRRGKRLTSSKGHR